MKFSRTKAMIQLIAGIVFSCGILVSSAFAAATWLSSVTGVNDPEDVALDAQGNLYVADNGSQGRLLVFDRKGNLLRTLRIQKGPIGVAVDNSGKVYVGSTSRKDGKYVGSVDVYNADFTLSHRLGKGEGEFMKPNSVAVAANGLVYVADTGDHMVKVYNPNGTASFAFGGYGVNGSENGKFSQPLSLAIDGAASELYVTDLANYVDGANGTTSGARVQVFDLAAGTFKRTFGQLKTVTGPGKVSNPLGIALDGAGRVYVTDIGDIFVGGQGIVQVFDGNGAYLETISDAAHPLKRPIGVAVGKDKRLFVSSPGGDSVEVFGLSGYTTMSVSPASLTFTAVEGTAMSAPQTVNVVNSGSGTLEWTAAADRSWIAVSAASSSALNVSANAAGFAAGSSSSGTVTVTATTGAIETVAVRLDVTPPPPVLSVSPKTLSFKAQEGGALPPAQAINIHNLASGVMTWTASTATSWLSLNNASGTAPSSVEVTVKNALTAGTHTGSVSIVAPGAQGSPVDVPVTVTVTRTGTVTVTTNLSQATFTLSGTATYSGTGTRWVNEDVAPGQYTVAFGNVTGYKKPKDQTITVSTGREATVNAAYAARAVKTHIAVVSGGATSRKVTVLALSGGQTASFQPFGYPAANVQAAAADLDGSGMDKIVVTDGVRAVKVYTADGTQLASLSLPKWHKNGTIAAGDLDGDGKAEILFGSTVSRLSRKDVRQVRQLALASGKLEEKAVLFSEEKDGRFSMALGDADGDGAAEAVLADAAAVRLLSLGNGSLSPVWTVQGTFSALPQVAAGDLNGDGMVEVVLSDAGIVHVLTAAGEPTGVMISTPKSRTRPEAASVSCGDADGDGLDEIAVGSAAGATSVPTVQLYKGDGTAAGPSLEAGSAGGSGVSVSLGSF